jgi:catechol 2,3-dioxygenase-like lactoylglutathione lyase family enzyme
MSVQVVGSTRSADGKAMPRFTFDHIHLRSPDPDATGRWYVETLEARQVGRMEGTGSLRVTLDLGGLAVFIDRVPAGTAFPPPTPFLGVEHLALAVTAIDAVVEELRGKGVRIVTEPTSPRPGVRIAFIEGPERVLIELLERSKPA